MLCAIWILRVDYSFADQGQGDADGAKEKRLAAPNTIKDEDDKDEV